MNRGSGFVVTIVEQKASFGSGFVVVEERRSEWWESDMGLQNSERGPTAGPDRPPNPGSKSPKVPQPGAHDMPRCRYPGARET